MYPPTKTQYVYVNESGSSFFTIIICLVLAFAGGIAFIKIQNSPETRAQIVDLIHRGQDAVLSLVDNQMFQDDNAIDQEEQFEGEQDPQFNPEFEQGHDHQQYRWVICEVPFQDCYGNWSTRRVAKPVKISNCLSANYR